MAKTLDDAHLHRGLVSSDTLPTKAPGKLPPAHGQAVSGLHPLRTESQNNDAPGWGVETVFLTRAMVPVHDRTLRGYNTALTPRTSPVSLPRRAEILHSETPGSLRTMSSGSVDTPQARSFVV